VQRLLAGSPLSLQAQPSRAAIDQDFGERPALDMVAAGAVGGLFMPVKEGKWKDACANVGELVLLYTALDHQLNLIIIEVMHLAPAPMLEAVVATLDPRQKIEMLKSRAGHVRQPDWKKAIKTHADRLERIAKMRNAACHTPMVENKTDGRFEFAAGAATKLLKSMTVRSKDDYTVDRVTLERVQEAIALGEKTLGGGEQILFNFAKVRTALNAKRTTSATASDDV
jgi:hypothetical protein